MNYRRPITLRPRNLLTKVKALKRRVALQRYEGNPEKLENGKHLNSGDHSQLNNVSELDEIMIGDFCIFLKRSILGDDDGGADEGSSTTMDGLLNSKDFDDDVVLDLDALLEESPQVLDDDGIAAPGQIIQHDDIYINKFTPKVTRGPSNSPVEVEDSNYLSADLHAGKFSAYKNTPTNMITSRATLPVY
ncbi:hypothetical protein PHJA_001403100 [Phtheirospermum japonicum]|uniref:Uncharacterized protein n=1 Tax=Phtheirospermum japonicum TaxID=374723 RepID=A0A830C0S6_9LAMI|nr:hypothetical protein PHJA_001403100 [Phtheirospermum japonicum]